MINFKLWSEVQPTAKAKLRPSLDLRAWGDLDDEEKVKVIRHLLGKGWFGDKDVIVNCVDNLNDKYKLNTFGKTLFEHGGPHSSSWGYESCCREAASKDFYRILKNEDTDVVLELLSIYAVTLIESYYLRKENPTAADVDEAYEKFDRFANAINSIFDHFAVNLTLTRGRFIPKQEKLVEEMVLEPTFRSLGGTLWEPVQKEFADAINEYHKGTKNSYSNAITHLVSALQAFLQVKVNGEIGKGDIDELIRSGVSKGILPNDELSKKVLNGLKSTVMEYRQKQGDAHPKKEYATDKSVRLLLNTVAVFIQHCIV